jgi:hypothetical protein
MKSPKIFSAAAPALAAWAPVPLLRQVTKEALQVF